MSYGNYQWAMELAGAKILAFESFGDYQGTWIAKVIYNNSIRWISGSYGSCSGCDAFESEVETWHDSDDENYHSISNYIDIKFKDCAQCQVLLEGVKDFGKGYLEDERSYKQLLESAKERADWDYDVKDVIAFLEANK